MESHRFSRFKRAPAVGPIQLTERDRAIIQLAYRHRFLRSSHIVSLLGGSAQQILRRLQLLYHHGFLDRPRAQIEYYHQGGSRHIVYGLGKKGVSLLKEEWGSHSRVSHRVSKSDSVGRLFFEHALLVSDVIVALELACHMEGGIRLLAAEELPVSGGIPRSFKWRVKVNNRVSLGVVPDRAFALVSGTESPDLNPTFFLLEADRGTMPIVRKSLSQSSFYRKLLAYEATWAQGLHRSHFGFPRFRVLTVTTSAARVESMIEACARLKSGHGLFLFCDQATLQKHGNIFTLLWKTGRQGETTSLID